MRRDLWLNRIQELDPEIDFVAIYRISSQYEFPWDTNQALGLALYRTYAVPSIGGLLAQTAEFTLNPQKRYDDTVLILESVIEHGFDSQQGRQAVRRMNQMHRRYAIANEDFVYVLATFVVVPKRWMDQYGWRTYSPHEIRATVNYCRELGRRMGLRAIPKTYEEFEQLLDSYERTHFGFGQGGREVSDTTLDLMASWFPRPTRHAVRLSALCLLDDPVRETFGYPAPSPMVRWAVRTGMRLRARFIRLLPPRSKPRFARNGRQIRGYPNGFRIADLGTFESDRATNCPAAPPIPVPACPRASRPGPGSPQ
ncbi:oxygenase MpaB family protein [Kitasatospora indigofera]|uniref:oxygenase MpaB family protein n=1 Tax=Kitasatospora indigofera TaxID=67307 RepID=UPI0036B128A8